MRSYSWVWKGTQYAGEEQKQVEQKIIDGDLQEFKVLYHQLFAGKGTPSYISDLLRGMILRKRLSFLKFMFKNYLSIKEYGAECLKESVSEGNRPAAKYFLLQGVNPNGDGFLLGDAVQSGLPMVKLLIEHGADPKGEGAMEIAVKVGITRTIKYLLDHGGGTKKIINEGLLTACYEGHLPAAKLFLKYGANIHYENESPLIVAFTLAHNWDKLFKFLLRNGANIGADQNYLLRVYAEEGNIDKVKKLISLGADVNANKGIALKAAIDNNRVETVQYLISIGGNTKGLDSERRRQLEAML